MWNKRISTSRSVARIEQNHIRNAQNGVTVQALSEATIRNNLIADNRKSPIAVLNAKATISDNVILRNAD